jgi:hypothetical protein
MLKRAFQKLFLNQNKTPKGALIVAEINDKIKPIDRGDVYEEPIDKFLKANKLGEICGGGTLLEKNGEILSCDIQMQLFTENPEKELLNTIIKKLEELGAPIGSKLVSENNNTKIEFGKLQGIALYLDGINLPDEVYRSADPFFLVSEIKKLAGIQTEVIREWTGESETGFYFYGDSYERIKDSIADFIATYPLCKGARIVRIA